MTAAGPGPREDLAQRLRDLLGPAGNVREVPMFGGISFMVDERMAVAAGRTGDLLVRTDPARRDELLQRGGVPALMGKNRPMGRGWLSVPGQQIHDAAELSFWVGVGVDSRDATA
ncbi:MULTISPECIES: TfoX/Sxy family protein [unclassified Arthrobacter]|uniref:TfoX/Sxy family protein n=1 Tax=unclassified Arthrobacter TaxID=235627 RepID=UPI002E0CE2FC|nr:MULTISPECIES: TfoX/Sxy family protein [unclassified Arthrobacter]MEC5193082.1 TfoX/Sxy family transcriptional regulator of competence genes [Arthrobacter sp. MP_M4]MEC5204701.1 TfoX/Sxy family transcriptional regulator of competence genes [Arthrobacter sp. MP_M7]